MSLSFIPLLQPRASIFVEHRLLTHLVDMFSHVKFEQINIYDSYYYEVWEKMIRSTAMEQFFLLPLLQILLLWEYYQVTSSRKTFLTHSCIDWLKSLVNATSKSVWLLCIAFRGIESSPDRAIPPSYLVRGAYTNAPWTKV